MTQTWQRVIGVVAVLLMAFVVILTGSIAESLVSDQSKFAGYLIFLGWPVLNYVLVKKVCVRGKYFLTLRLLSFLLVHLAFAAIVLRLKSLM